MFIYLQTGRRAGFDMGVIKAIKEFIAERGFTLMIIGIVVAAVGVLLCAFIFFTPRLAMPYNVWAAKGLAVLGFAMYFTGRSSVYIRRSRSKRDVMEMLAARDRENEEADD
jgi:uncharacterized membrane protein